MWNAASAFRACVPALAATVLSTALSVAWSPADAARGETTERAAPVTRDAAGILPRRIAPAESRRPARAGLLVEVPADRMPPKEALIRVD